MKATTTKIRVGRGERRLRAVGRRSDHGIAVLRDPTVPARPFRAVLSDDGSRTPPHGDAVLPRRRPA